MNTNKRMAGIEPVCPAWEAGALTIVLHPQTKAILYPYRRYCQDSLLPHGIQIEVLVLLFNAEPRAKSRGYGEITMESQRAAHWRSQFCMAASMLQFSDGLSLNCNVLVLYLFFEIFDLLF